MLDVTQPPFHAVGDGVTDDWQAITDAIAAASAITPHAGAVNPAETVYFPPGEYYCSASIDLDAAVVLVGANGGIFDSASILTFPPGVPGIVVHRANTSPSGGRADWAMIEKLHVRASGQDVPDVDGITLYARATLCDVWVRGFSRHGVAIRGGLGEGPAGETTNANVWFMHQVRTSHNGADGLHVIGRDANAGCAVLLNSVLNGGWGLYDGSMLGNTYVQAHTSNNQAGAYATVSPTNRSTLLGCYAEMGQGQGSLLAQGSMWIGGVQDQEHQNSLGAFLRVQSSGVLESTRPIVVQNDAGAIAVRAGLSDHSSAMSVLTFKASDEPLEWRLRRDLGGRPGWWGIAYGNNANLAPLLFAAASNPDFPVGFPLFPQGFSVGLGSSVTVRHTVGASAPSSGTHNRGDVVHNYKPSAVNGKVLTGWICTAPGTPGQWTPMYAVTEP